MKMQIGQRLEEANPFVWQFDNELEDRKAQAPF